MGNELTVYNKMKTSTDMLCEVLKKEIGIKSTCIPFAVRAVDALNSLGTITESEGRQAANIFLDGLQTLIMGGTTTEDYDKIDMVKRGKTITLSLRVEGLIRAAARKGYRIVPTFVAVPKESNIYFEETMQGGEICYLLKDDRKVGDREITAERFIKGYFDKFICRLEIRAVKTNTRVAMTTVEMSNAEVMAAHNASDNGLYYSNWVDNGTGRKVKVFADGSDGKEPKFNKTSFWWKWTSEMIYKTVLRRAIKKVRDALPELESTFYSFDEQPTIIETPQEKPIEMPKVEIKSDNVDLYNLTEDQKKDADEVLEIYKANPARAVQEASEIMRKFYEGGKTAQELVNTHFAELACLMRGKTAESIKALLDELKDGAK